jgi:3-oxoacyl-[acyl-carrier-protein] synthase-3
LFFVSLLIAPSAQELEPLANPARFTGARALESAGEPKIDAVIVATTSPDRLCPAVGPEVAARLDLGTVAAYDINSACSGFLYGLATATGLIASGIAGQVLLIGSEAFTTLVNPADRVTRPIFGDGAGAVVLRKGDKDEPGAIGPFDLGSDGSRADLLAISAGGSRQRSAAGLGLATTPVEDWYLRMDGHAIFTQAVTRIARSVQTVLKRAQWSCADVDWFIGHQANVRILHMAAEMLELPKSKIAMNIDRVGNTLAASLPLLLNDMVDRGDLKPGHRVLMSAFGAGLSWGSTVLTWPDLSVRKIE